MQLIWQPCLKEVKHQDLVIVESANSLMLNYLLMMKRHFSSLKLGFWGHGRNMQNSADSWTNKLKVLFLHNCDWWFAYTAGVKKNLVNQGYPEHQITAVQNAINTNVLQEQYAQISDAESAQLKAELGIVGNQIGIFCGGMYPEKRIDFLLDSCMIIKDKVPDFHMIFIGSGIDAQKVALASSRFEWIHYLGPKFGNDQIKYFKIASLFLMPGLVGLGVLDSFALETPMVTTNYEFHSPEIEYLEDGKNGVVVANAVEDYADAIVKLLLSKSYERMLAHCKTSAEKYTVEKMVENYKTGILKAIH